MTGASWLIIEFQRQIVIPSEARNLPLIASMWSVFKEVPTMTWQQYVLFGLLVTIAVGVWNCVHHLQRIDEILTLKIRGG